MVGHNNKNTLKNSICTSPKGLNAIELSNCLWTKTLKLENISIDQLRSPQNISAFLINKHRTFLINQLIQRISFKYHPTNWAYISCHTDMWPSISRLPFPIINVSLIFAWDSNSIFLEKQTTVVPNDKCKTNYLV